VALSSYANAAPPVGSELIYVATVKVANAATVSGSRLEVTVPAGITVTKTYADRGPGCDLSGSSLACDTAWLSPGVETHVTVWTRVRTAGELDLTATVKSLLEPELDPTNNTATLKLLPAASAGSLTPPPAVTRRPLITGVAVVGRTLRAGTPTWTQRPQSLTWQWLLCTRHVCKPIAGATRPTLKLAHAYAGHSVEAVATARFAGVTIRSASKPIVVRARSG
jgi:hypothetical protein